MPKRGGQDMKKLLIVCLCLLMMTGCSSSDSDKKEKSSTDTSSTDSLDNSFYPMVNLGTNLIRENYYADFYSSDDFQNIGRELQILATEHFSTSEYYMSEGLQLVKKDKDKLLKRADDPKQYPYTLQPDKGSSLEDVQNPAMVENICEQDLYVKNGTDYTLSGMAIAIIVDPTGGSDHRLSDNTINNFGKQAIEKLYQYLQSKKDLKDVPVLIAVYQENVNSENSYNGKFILSSYCTGGSVGDIHSLDYDTYIFTSDDATNADESTASQFSVFKNNLKNASTEAIGVIGYGKYRNNTIQSLKIQLTVNVKTYTELIYLIELAADEMDSRFTGFDCYAVVNDQDGLKAVIIKKAGEDAQSQLLY